VTDAGEALPFEECLERLEAIVHALEAGNLPLDESLRVFEEGIALARRCGRYLEEAERRVDVLVKDEAGTLVQRPFRLPAEESQ
jgi:exodeoxyribonuclease VII small subunit